MSPFVDLLLSALHRLPPEERLTVKDAVTAHTQGASYAEL